MSGFVLNIVAGANASLAAHDVEGVKQALTRAGFRAGAPTWLAEGKALDVGCEGDPIAARDAVRAAFSAQAFDINAVAIKDRRKKLLVADMDSTIIGCECLDELADMAGIKEKVAAITERAMRGELDFAAALRERVGLIKGLSIEALARTYAERVRLNPGAKLLLATMRANGAHTMLVSGGFTYFTGRVAEEAGFETHQGNTLLDDGKSLTGKVGEPILGREAKLKALEDGMAEFGLDASQTLAVGDGANDLDMIRRAGLGVAYRAKPVVADAAGAAISHGDLTALLYLQGYKRDEFVRA